MTIHSIMSFAKVGRSALAVLTAMLLTLATSSASATTYKLEQDGWTGGGLLTGSFSGDDLNGDGFISSFDNEVTSFTASFTGNGDMTAFNFVAGNLQGLIYRLDGGALGDDMLPLGEGLSAASANFMLISGIAAAGTTGAFLFDLVSGGATTTDSMVSVSAVPEPQSLLPMMGGLVMLLGTARMRVR